MRNPLARNKTKVYNLPPVDIGDLPDLIDEWNQEAIDAQAAAALKAAVYRNATYNEIMSIIAENRTKTANDIDNANSNS